MSKTVTTHSCGKEKSRYEVKIKDVMREFWICWPCHDKMKGIDR